MTIKWETSTDNTYSLYTNFYEDRDEMEFDIYDERNEQRLFSNITRDAARELRDRLNAAFGFYGGDEQCRPY